MNSLLSIEESGGFLVECVYEYYRNQILEVDKQDRKKNLIAKQNNNFYCGKFIIIIDNFMGFDISLLTFNDVLNQYSIKILFIPTYSYDQE